MRIKQSELKSLLLVTTQLQHPAWELLTLNCFHDMALDLFAPLSAGDRELLH